MKHTFTEREMSGPAQAASGERRVADVGEGARGGGAGNVLKGAGSRVLVVLAVSAVALVCCMGTKILQVITGALVVLFQSALIEVIGGLLRRQSGGKAANSTERSLVGRRWNAYIWSVQWVLCVAGVILWTLYWRIWCK